MNTGNATGNNGETPNPNNVTGNPSPGETPPPTETNPPPPRGAHRGRRLRRRSQPRHPKKETTDEEGVKDEAKNQVEEKGKEQPKVVAPGPPATVGQPRVSILSKTPEGQPRASMQSKTPQGQPRASMQSKTPEGQPRASIQSKAPGRDSIDSKASGETDKEKRTSGESREESVPSGEEQTPERRKTVQVEEEAEIVHSPESLERIAARKAELERNRKEFTQLDTVSRIIRKPRRKARLVAVGGGQNPFLLKKYGAMLYQQLMPLWVPLGILGRLPWKVRSKGEVIEISITRANPLFWLGHLYMITHLSFWCYLTFSIVHMYQNKPYEHIHGERNCTTISLWNIRTFETKFIAKYLMEVALMYFTITHATIVSANIMMKCYDYAAFVREWFRLADLCKLAVHQGIFWLIIRELFFIVIFASLNVLIYYSDVFSGVFGGSSALTLVILRLQYMESDYCFAVEPYWHKYSWIGLAVHTFCIVSSRMGCMFYIILQRIYGNSWRSFNKRLEMAFGRRPVEKDDQHRIRWRILSQDFATLQTQGAILGPVFKFNAGLWYCLQVFSLVLEIFMLAGWCLDRLSVGRIVYQAKDEENKTVYLPLHDKIKYREKITGCDLHVLEPPILEVINILGRLVVSMISLLHFAWEADLAGKNAAGHAGVIRLEGFDSSTKDLGKMRFIIGYNKSILHKHPPKISAAGYFFITIDGATEIIGNMVFLLIILVHFSMVKLNMETRFTGGTKVGQLPISMNTYTCEKTFQCNPRTIPLE